MKKSNLAAGLVYLFIGVLFLFAAMRTDNSMLGSLFCGFTGAGIGPGILMIYKYYYWGKPGNKERYAEKLEHEKIERNDELKMRLRDKSGRYAYAAGLVAVSISIVIFSVLGALGIISNPYVIVLYLGGYFVFQVIIGIVFFHHLSGKYK